MSDGSSFFPSTRITLIRALTSGGAHAWDEFFSIYGPLIHRLARSSGLQENEADDVVANVMRGFLKAVRAGFELDPSRGRFRHYLRTIARREIASHFRSRGRSAGAATDDELRAIPDDALPPDELWADAEREERLRTCLDRLRASASVRSRDLNAFEQYALRGVAPADVARRFGIPVGHVYTIKHRMLRRLRRIYGELQTDFGEV